MNDTPHGPWSSHPPRNLSTYSTLPTYLIYPWSNSSQSGGFAKLKFFIFASQPFAALRSLLFGSVRLLDEVGPRPDQTRISEHCLILFSFFHVMLLLYHVWSYSIVSLIHHLCKRETKRNVEAIICLVSSGMRFLCYIHTVLYSIHGVYTGRDPQIPEIPKKRSRLHLVECKSGFGLVVLLPCVWNVCKVHTGMIRMGIKWRSPRRKGKPWSFFLGTWARELTWPDPTWLYPWTWLTTLARFFGGA